MTTAIRLDQQPAIRTPTRTRPPEVHSAGWNRSRHWARDLTRVVALGMADLGAVAALQTLIRTARDHGMLGDGLRGLFQFPASAGALGGRYFSVALLLALAVAGAYGRGRRRDTGPIVASVALAGLLLLYRQAWEQTALTAAHLTAVTALVAPGVILSRRAAEALLALAVPGIKPSRLVVVTAGARDWIHHAGLPHGHDSGDPRFRVAAIAAANGHPSANPLRNLPGIIRATRADTVLIAGPLRDRDLAFVTDAALASGCRLLAAPRLPRIAGVQPRTVWEGDTPLVELTAPARQARHLAAKRVVDLCLASVALLTLSPLLLIIGALIRLESPGPAIFAHWRLGVHGRRFRCYKFRSMQQDAEQILRADPALYQLYVDNGYKLPASLDPRLTRIGRFLRKCSLDELPQLLNVILGDMSMVGPRPIVPDELSHYGKAASLFLSRRPGITGNWAANGRSEVGYPDRVQVELAYARQWSLLHDLSLMLRTIPAVARRRGAH